MENKYNTNIPTRIYFLQLLAISTNPRHFIYVSSKVDTDTIIVNAINQVYSGLLHVLPALDINTNIEITVQVYI